MIEAVTTWAIYRLPGFDTTDEFRAYIREHATAAAPLFLDALMPPNGKPCLLNILHIAVVEEPDAGT